MQSIINDFTLGQLKSVPAIRVSIGNNFFFGFLFTRILICIIPIKTVRRNIVMGFAGNGILGMDSFDLLHFGCQSCPGFDHEFVKIRLLRVGIRNICIVSFCFRQHIHSTLSNHTVRHHDQSIQPLNLLIKSEILTIASSQLINLLQHLSKKGLISRYLIVFLGHTQIVGQHCDLLLDSKTWESNCLIGMFQH